MALKTTLQRNKTYKRTVGKSALLHLRSNRSSTARRIAAMKKLIQAGEKLLAEQASSEANVTKGRSTSTGSKILANTVEELVTMVNRAQSKEAIPIGSTTTSTEGFSSTISSTKTIVTLPENNYSFRKQRLTTKKFDTTETKPVKDQCTDETTPAVPKVLDNANNDLLEIFKVASDQESLGKLLRDYRKEAGLTQEQIAKHVGCSRPHISDIEKGKVDPQWGTVVSYIEAFSKVPA